MGDHDGRFVGVTGEPTVEILKIESLMMKAEQESQIAPINEKNQIKKWNCLLLSLVTGSWTFSNQAMLQNDWRRVCKIWSWAAIQIFYSKIVKSLPLISTTEMTLQLALVKSTNYKVQTKITIYLV